MTDGVLPWFDLSLSSPAENLALDEALLLTAEAGAAGPALRFWEWPGYTVVVGAGLFYWLSSIGVDGVLGLAVATSLSAWINVALLGGTLMRENVWRPSPAFLSRLFRVLAASAVMAGLLVIAGIGYETLSRVLLAKEIAVLVVCGVGGLVYAACIVLFRAVSVSELKATLKREPGASDKSVPPTGLD